MNVPKKKEKKMVKGAFKIKVNHKILKMYYLQFKVISLKKNERK